MVQAVVLVGALNRLDVARALDHADDAAVPLLGGADLADIAGGVVLADAAAVQVTFGVLNRLGQLHGLLGRHRHDLIGHTHRTFAANTGKLGKLVDQIFQRLNIVVEHRQPLNPDRGCSDRRSSWTSPPRSPCQQQRRRC